MNMSTQLHAQHLWIVTWKPWQCVCVPVCQTPWLDWHALVHEFMSTWLPMYALPPMHSLMETWVPLYGSVFVFQSPHFCSHTLFRMCIWIVHVLMSIWLPILAWPPLHSYIEKWVPLCSTVCVYQSLHFWYMYLCLLDSPCLLHHFSIQTWKHGFFCVALWVCCSNPTPWLECVHASVHVYMYT